MVGSQQVSRWQADAVQPPEDTQGRPYFKHKGSKPALGGALLSPAGKRQGRRSAAEEITEYTQTQTGCGGCAPTETTGAACWIVCVQGGEEKTHLSGTLMGPPQRLARREYRRVGAAHTPCERRAEVTGQTDV